MDLGQLIVNYREEHNMSLRAFARAAGVSATYISTLERGRNARGSAPVPSVDTYRAIASAMGIDVDTLIRMVDDRIDINDDDLMEELQMLRDNPETRTLLHSSKGLTREQLAAVTALMKQMRGND